MRAKALSTLVAMAALLCCGIATASANATEAAPNAQPSNGCTAADIGAAVDQSAEQIRAFSSKSQPEIAARMRRYAEAVGLSGDATEDTVFEQLYDAKLEDLDRRSGELLLTVDQLGRMEEGAAPDCARSAEISATTTALLQVMQQKSDYVLARLDEKTPKGTAAPANTTPEKVATEPTAKETTAPPAAKTKPEKSAAAPTAEKPAGPKPAADKAPPAQSAAETWTAETRHNDAYIPPSDDSAAVTPANPTQPLPTSDGGYSIDEIRDATRGFFGTISTNLASVIEHAFKTSGRPTAYVLGTEGGGAFLAGLRYGKGRLFKRNQSGITDVYWHGPSLGTDFGASGSRTMFLIYGLADDADIHRIYTGVDGSAYFVGGVGLTLMKGGDVIMAPIRSGIGFRFGANIGYVRFTQKPTWNPF